MPVKLLLSRTASGRRRRPRRRSAANLCWSLCAASCHRWCTPTQRLGKVTEKKRESENIRLPLVNIKYYGVKYSLDNY